eukprot:m.54086 g.54086  ORF g.54086 m.54086 type:complete len:66 (+) comp11389_c0_seq2:196-393(+)
MTPQNKMQRKHFTVTTKEPPRTPNESTAYYLTGVNAVTLINVLLPCKVLSESLVSATQPIPERCE